MNQDGRDLRRPGANPSRPDLPSTASSLSLIHGRLQTINHEQSSAQQIRLVFILKLWIRIFAKAALVTTPVLLFYAIYFLPAQTIPQSTHGIYRKLLYFHLGIVILWYFFYGFTTVYFIYVFGYHYCRRAIPFALAPGFMVGHFLTQISMTFIGVCFSTFCLLLAIFLIHKEKLPIHPTELQQQQFERKNQTLKPLMKMIITIFSLHTYANTLIPFYTTASFQQKLFVRFFVIPLLVSLCSSIQIHYMKAVPTRHLDHIFPVFWISNGILKIYERLFTNSIFRSGNYIYFSLSMLLAALIEMATHATYFYRNRLFQKIINLLLRMSSGNRALPRTISVISQHDDRSGDADARYAAWLNNMRKKILIEDLATELIMVLTVTIVLYLVNPLVTENVFDAIQSLEECVIKIVLQLLFEFISDIFGLFWALSRDSITIDPREIQIKDEWFLLRLYFITWQSASLLDWFIS